MCPATGDGPSLRSSRGACRTGPGSRAAAAAFVAALLVAPLILPPVAFPTTRAAQKDRALFPGEEPAVSPDGRTIAFRRWVEGNSEIFIAPLDGSAPPRRFTNNTALDRSPAWSPDGREICFVSNRAGNKDLWVAEVDHPDAARQLTTNSGPDEDPAWSPDGTRILYVARAERTTDLYVIPAGGGEPVRITDNSDEESHPTWSPDGRRVAFATDRQDARNIWMIDFGAISDRPRTTADRTASGVLYHIYQLTKGAWDDGDPAWCPSSDLIAFSSTRRSDFDASGGAATAGGGNGSVAGPAEVPRQIFFVTTGPRPILTGLTSTVSVLEAPAWLPGGHDLAYVSTPRAQANPDQLPSTIHILEGARR